ncbi:MAG: DRTGG domain-containing protein [Phycisphaerae bacterium]|jgi:BioD-like phosphotransacetylase family protein
MKPLYIVGTQRDVGKTTFCIGLISALQHRGLRVGYTKPLGQRVTLVDGQQVHDDAMLVSQVMNVYRPESASLAVPLTRGRVEQEIYELHEPELAEKVATVCKRLEADNDVIIVEGMGHVAMGSALKLSAAEVARLIGARAMLISGGGIGRALDDISLCATYLTARGADLMGTVINKVWPEKYDRVKEATTKGLEHLGLRSFGTVPYQQLLASPTVGQVARQLGARILCGTGAMGNRVGKVIVAGMEANHMVSYLKDGALAITPGDRTDNILAIISTYTLVKEAPPPVAGLILTGGFLPMSNVMNLLVESGLPALQCSEDTFTLAGRVQDTVFKITPDDRQRIQMARDLIGQYVDVPAILEGLQE